jgi:hypothetical protein
MAELGMIGLRDADRDAIVCQDSTGTAVPMKNVIAACALDVKAAQARGVSVDPLAVALAQGMLTNPPSGPAVSTDLAQPSRVPVNDDLSVMSNGAVQAAGADLSSLFAKDTAVKGKLKALRQFGATAQARIKDLSSMADQCAEILNEVVARLPIRTLDTLRAEYGDETERLAQEVIDDAAKLAGWLWTAAAAVPGPPPVVHAVKVIVQSAMEIRMIGELYAIHEEAHTAHDSIWLSTVLMAWASGHPIAVGGPSIAGIRDITAKVRRSFGDLTSADSRLVGVTSRGREGSGAVSRLGMRQHRRMRLHPSMWEAAKNESTVDMIRESATRVILSRVPALGRVPRPSSIPIPGGDGV